MITHVPVRASTPHARSLSILHPCLDAAHNLHSSVHILASAITNAANMAPKSKTVLITGCSADGVGATLAQTIAEQGHHVYATARNTAKIPPALRELDNVTTLQLDVSSAASIAAAGKAVRDAGLGLDVLVNNAGEEQTMPLLDVNTDADSPARDVFEVNVWGPLRLAQTFADLLVERKGRIVNLTAADAELCPPWIGRFLLFCLHNGH